MTISLIDLCVHFKLQLGWACAYILHNLRTENKGILGKWSEDKTGNWHTSKLHVENKPSKVHFLRNYEHFFSH